MSALLALCEEEPPITANKGPVIQKAFEYHDLRCPQHDEVTNGNISTLLTFCAGNSPVTGEFPAQKPVTRSFDVFFEC